MENPKEVETAKSIEEHDMSRYPQNKFIHWCNTLQQEQIFKEYRLNAIFCNHNCLIDEIIFQPIPDTYKLFDAVYDARMSPLL